MGGAEKTVDPEKIKGAEAAVKVVTDHAKLLPTASPGVASSTGKAYDSVRALLKQGDWIKVFLSKSDLESRESPPVADPKLAQIEDATSGHHAPPRVMDREHAERHSRIVTMFAETQIEAHQSGMEAVSKVTIEEKSFFENVWDGIKAVGNAIAAGFEAVHHFVNSINAWLGDTLGSLIFPRPVSKAEKQVFSWLDESYLGKEIADRFRRTPPVITLEPRSFFDTHEEAYGYPTIGLYFGGTNHIALDRKLDRLQSPIEDTSAVVAHEYLHYAAYLGGGQNIRYTDSDGNYHSGKYIKPLHEGLTELHTQELVRSHDMTPSYVSYTLEVLSASFLQHLVGSEVLKEAYLTGNFTKVAELVDAKLGKGTFNEFMSKLDVSPLEALVFLQTKAADAKIDLLTWAENPIVIQAKKQIGVTG